jgi:hypothetical protein
MKENWATGGIIRLSLVGAMGGGLLVPPCRCDVASLVGAMRGGRSGHVPVGDAALGRRRDGGASAESGASGSSSAAA